VHDPSVVVDPRAFEWRNAGWRGRPWHETVLYEVHAGAMGGFKGVQAALPRLRDLGVTAVELMPIADFPASATGATTACCPTRPTRPTARRTS
jgi:maltooligosyltrehalose trehalohydrolase